MDSILKANGLSAQAQVEAGEMEQLPNDNDLKNSQQYLEGIVCHDTVRESTTVAFREGVTYFRPEAIAKGKNQVLDSRTILIYLSPADFLSVAMSGHADHKAGTVQSLIEGGTLFDDLPLLNFVHDGEGTARVTGHEGRHRARALQALGVTRMPVLLSHRYDPNGQPMMWRSIARNPNIFQDEWPHKLYGEFGNCEETRRNRDNFIAFPVPDLRLVQELGPEDAMRAEAAAHQHDNYCAGDLGYCDASSAVWSLNNAFPMASLKHLKDDWVKWFGEEISMDESEGLGRNYAGMLTGEIIEEVIVFVRDGKGYIWDGWHRVAAAIVGGKETIKAIVGVPLPALCNDDMNDIRSGTDDFLKWLHDDRLGLYQVTEQSLEVARAIALEGWCERAGERQWPIPSDLAGACKFSTLFAKSLFGGVLQGTIDHQYNLIDGKIVDLNANAEDVQALRTAGRDVYQHDEYFFGNEEHLDSMLSCLPRITLWRDRFVTALKNLDIGANSTHALPSFGD